MKKIIWTILIFFILPIIVFANSDYEFNKYKLNVEVKENHTYNYEENITVEFFGNEKTVERKMIDEQHNFTINKNYMIETSDISIAKIYNDQSIDKIQIKYNYKDENIKNNYYEFKYTNLYDQQLEGLDFEITLPTSATAKNIKIYNGNYDITDIVDYKVKGRVVTGTYNKVLKPGEALTFEIDYGRFYMSTATLVCLVIPIVLTVFSYLLWRLFGKDLPTTVEKTSKFSRNISTLHIALANNGVVTDDDTYYMLLDLATKGYITIVEQKNDFYFKKNKDYHESNYLESVFFKTLFRAGESISLAEYINIMSEHKDDKKKIYQADRVEPKNIQRKFKNASNTIKEMLDKQNESVKYYEETPERMKNVLLLMVALILILITSLPFLEIGVLTLLPLSVILSIAILYVLVTFVKSINIKSETHLSFIIFTLATIFLIIILVPSFQRDIGFIIAFLTSLICSGIILFIYKYMPKRTIYGQRIYNKIQGFQYLIKNIKKEELDRILELNPNYLFDILPYAYQLGVAEEVYELIEKRKMAKPEWFVMNGKFSYPRLNNSILRLKEILTKDKDVI